MALLASLFGEWQRWTCSHRWVRARWDDGSYGMRCSQCMKPYPHTWNEIISQPPAPSRPLVTPLAVMPVSRASQPVSVPAAHLAELPSLRRAA